MQPGTAGFVVLAVDDEAPAVDDIAFLLRENPLVEQVHTATDVSDALHILRADVAGTWDGTDADAGVECPIDVVFLDIRMPGLDGVDLARVLGTLRNPPAIVFVTAHDDRAIEAYDVGAVDYLLKPLRAERLAASLRRIERTRSPVVAPREPAESDEVIPVELAGSTKLIPRSEVRFVEAKGDYARLHTEQGSHLVRIPLAQLEERWSAVGFVRIHRSYLVALPLVTELKMIANGYVVRVGSGPTAVELPVSRRHTRDLKERLVNSQKGVRVTR